MSCCPPNSDNKTEIDEPACDCGTGQVRSDIACPVCRKHGMTVNHTTPENTLKRQVRDRLDPDGSYHFCENPDCDAVYYNEKDTRVFGKDDLIHRVTVKDNSPDTRLCYCFKVLKRQALEEIAETGSTNVAQIIQAKMKPGQSCFCEKANPRGDTCIKDINDWLAQQGVRLAGNVISEGSVGATTTSSCCGPAPAPAQTSTGCCGDAPVTQTQKQGCC